MIRIATIGSNFIVHQFIEGMKEVPHVQYAAVYSRTQETADELAGQYGVAKTYTSLEALAADPQIDAVYIASPNRFHAEQSILMMNHGKHVLCEKPISTNAKELAQMEAAAKANGVVLMEALKTVSMPGFHAIVKALPRLGAIRHVSFNYSQYSSRYDKFKAGIIENAFNPALSNGALMDIGTYPIHMLLALFGTPKKVQASGIKLSNGVDGAGAIICEYDDFLATLAYSKITSYEDNVIQGENGTLKIDRISEVSKVEFIDREGTVHPLELEAAHSMSYEIHDFIHAIQSGSVDTLSVSRQKMQFQDEIRKQLGIIFPADQ